jgi:hypothetical protein
LLTGRKKDVDARDKRGHDEKPGVIRKMKGAACGAHTGLQDERRDALAPPALTNLQSDWQVRPQPGGRSQPCHSHRG